MSDGVPTRSRRPLWIGLAALAAVAAVVVVLTVFQPQKLFIDDRVDEALPVGTAAPPVSGDGPGDPPPTTAPGPSVLRAGAFVSLDHGTSGRAQVVQVDGASYLRIEELDTDNGPDLYVYLTVNPAGGPEGAFDDDFVDLGRLKGNVGNQNYELPAGTDLARYTTVVIWCDRFNSAFGAADLA